MSLARTSNAPLKMYGNPSTLLTWLGKSERPVAIIASSRTAFTSSGIISGVGFASAKMIGLADIFATISPVTNPPFESPRKTSAPTNASARVPSSASTAKGALNSFKSPSFRRFFVMIPFESHITILLIFTPRET